MADCDDQIVLLVMIHLCPIPSFRPHLFAIKHINPFSAGSEFFRSKTSLVSLSALTFFRYIYVSVGYI